MTLCPWNVTNHGLTIEKVNSNNFNDERKISHWTEIICCPSECKANSTYSILCAEEYWIELYFFSSKTAQNFPFQNKSLPI